MLSADDGTQHPHCRPSLQTKWRLEEHETADESRVMEGEVDRDHTAHAPADDHGGRPVGLDQRREIVGVRAQRPGRLGARRREGATRVGDDTVVWRQHGWQ